MPQPSLCCPMDSLLDSLAVGAFIVMTAVALCCPLVPFFASIASHGKTRQPTTANNGKDNNSANHSQPNKSQHWLLEFVLYRLVVPKRYFTHFYIVGMLSLCCRGYCLGMANHWRRLQLLDVKAVLFLHLSRRWYECLLVHQWTRTSHMHVAIYAVGWIYYLLLPSMFFPISYNNNNNNATDSTHILSSSAAAAQWRVTGRIGLVLVCLWAQFQQHRHHVILAKLRTTPPPPQQRLEETKAAASPVAVSAPLYRLPEGGWFQYISCPHYTAEILLYTGLCGLTMWGDKDDHNTRSSNNHRLGLLMVWVVTVLTVSGLESHHWYLNKFPSYAQLNRSAVIPFLV